MSDTEYGRCDVCGLDKPLETVRLFNARAIVHDATDVAPGSVLLVQVMYCDTCPPPFGGVGTRGRMIIRPAED